MGFLVPQVRKEIRITNQQLREMGRDEIVYREMLGSSIDQADSFAVPASRNVYHALRKLYEEESVSTVYWITPLKGQQSSAGFALLETLLSQHEESSPKRELVIRNVWQEQLVQGESWVIKPPELNTDPLDERSRPGEWYRLLENGRGIVLRSWQTPPTAHREQFAFPFRVRSPHLCRRLQIASGEAYFDLSWAKHLRKKHQLSWMTDEESWHKTFTGRRWVSEATLIPFPDADSLHKRSSEVLTAMMARPTIQEDLAKIPTKKIGIVFGFGYLGPDLVRFKRYGETRLSSISGRYIKDLMRIVRETRRHQEEVKGESYHYRNEFVELHHKNRVPEGIDPIVAQIGDLITTEKVEAIYLFTNGYLGKTEYGGFTLDLDLLERGIQERKIPLFVRVPFELGIAPKRLISLAKESGGQVFFGDSSDPDWNWVPRK